MTKIRTRFAPSPTGALHIGGARTALFNWLFARKNEGDFILRIEDTDQARSTAESTAEIFSALTWLGLTWDEEPAYQSQRLPLYHEQAQRLLKSGQAYETERPPVQGENKGGTALMFKTADEKVDDFIIIKADGLPTYHFAVVVDDWQMGITHVIRGSDHLPNTPKHIKLYQALGVKPPKFVHVPMILGSDGQRLSKRHGATAVTAYRQQGYLPAALINYLARLGWAYRDQEIFSRAELIKLFSLSGIGKSDAVFDPQKLTWLNGHYLRQSSSTSLLAILNQDFGTQLEAAERVTRIVSLLQERAKLVPDILEGLTYFLGEQLSYDLSAVEQYLTPDNLQLLAELRLNLPPSDQWTSAQLELAIRDFAVKRGLVAGQIIHPLRVAITGRAHSPGLFETAELIGYQKVMERLDNLPGQEA